MKKKLLHNLIKISITSLFILVLLSYLITYKIIDLNWFFSEGKSETIRIAITTNFTDYFDIFKYFKKNMDIILTTLSRLLFTIVAININKFIFMRFYKRFKNFKTVIILAENIVKYIIIFIFTVITLSSFGVNNTVLASLVGSIGIAIGFSAQGLLGDVISGFFNIIEGRYVLGDSVAVNNFKGIVVKITIRSISIQNWLGEMMIIDNSSYRNIINFSKDSNLAICDLPISYTEDLHKAEKVVLEACEIFNEKHPELLLIYAGVQELGESSVILRITTRCKIAEKFKLERELRKEFKLAFDANGIVIPFNQLVVHLEK